MRYATLEQMQDMEFGVTGDVVTIDNGWGPVRFERLIHRDDPSLFGWAALHDDAKGEMVDWDRVDEDEARKFGLVK